MKRLSSSDSFGGLMSICPNATEEHDAMFSGEFPAMMDEDCGMEESGHVSEKKRRLSIDQVKALEKNFEVENKLEPERKVKLAQELGLQPRQVAVWFQNRRARWKTKQLERDYGALKANYDGLKLSFERLQHDKESLLKEIHDLKSKIDGNSNGEGDAEGNTDIKIAESAEIENSSGGKNGGGGWPKFGDLKDGSSDSDSSAIVNDDMNSSSPREVVKGSASSMNVMSFQMGERSNSSYEYEPQFVKIEEHNFFGEESCSTFFSDDQAPTLQWYCNDQWN